MGCDLFHLGLGVCRAGSYYKLSVSINSTLLPEKPRTCCLQQGRFTFLCRLKQLFQTVTEKLRHLQLSFSRLSTETGLRKCELCLFIPGCVSLSWEACLCLRGWNPTSPSEKSYLVPSRFPFLQLFPLGACCQPQIRGSLSESKQHLLWTWGWVTISTLCRAVDWTITSWITG